MKKIKYVITCLYAFSVTVMSGKLTAQEIIQPKKAEIYNSEISVDGDKLIKSMANERYVYNKNLIKHTKSISELPKSQSIMDKQILINFNGHDYLIVNREIKEVKGIELSKTALSILSDKLNQLDHFQKLCSDKVNLEYSEPDRDLQYIKTLDRQYFSSLNQFAEITRDIERLSKKINPSITIEMALEKINIPSIDKLSCKNKAALTAK